MQIEGLVLPLEPEVGPSAARVNTKGSCVYPLGHDPDTGESKKYGLYVDDNPKHGSTTIHNVPLGNDLVKVGIEEVRDVDVHVPVPTQEVQLAR